MLIGLLNIIKTIRFFILAIKTGQLSNSLECTNKGCITVLANGPSLKEVIPELTVSERFRDCDFIVMNFFANEDVCYEIKPKHYCLADPMFFHQNHRYGDVKALFDVLQNKVSWNMNLYVPKDKFKDFLSFSKITNSNINIVPINSVPYLGIECMRNFVYKKGWSIPQTFTVAILAIYVGIITGYSEVRLYGVDHTFFDSLCVNEKNQLCNYEKHFYDNSEVKLKPIIRNDNDQVYSVSGYLTIMYNIFHSHDLLASFAKYMNVKVINCTKCSMIDSYERNV